MLNFLHGFDVLSLHFLEDFLRLANKFLRIRDCLIYIDIIVKRNRRNWVTAKPTEIVIVAETLIIESLIIKTLIVKTLVKALIIKPLVVVKSLAVTEALIVKIVEAALIEIVVLIVILAPGWVLIIQIRPTLNKMEITELMVVLCYAFLAAL